ncbi:hypothetical protein Patl1_27545 [Pistacia atlantica]|uniref:Uncharacterized protein n=1 Tax=Pistacia atlantica TaxID=434234 RepID=A0ACC1BDU5_9ROSI|nr:hypothetical protein Patl1_27545 [Pistacia atlantica]
MNTKVGDSCVEIPENFFKGITKLKVLELTRMQFSSVQSSLHLLGYLQTLCLDYRNFEDVVIIGKLEKLKVLSLRGEEDFSDYLLCKFGEWDYKKRFDEHETLRMLKLIEHDSIIRSRELECFKNVEVLCLRKLKGFKNVLYELDQRGVFAIETSPCLQ